MDAPRNPSPRTHAATSTRATSSRLPSVCTSTVRSRSQRVLSTMPCSELRGLHKGLPWRPTRTERFQGETRFSNWLRRA